MRYFQWATFIVCFVTLAAPVAADTNIGVRGIIPAKPEHELLSRQFKSLVEGELTRQLLEAQESGKCDVRIFDLSPYNIETRNIEKGLQEDGITDQKTAVPIEEIPADTFVDGVVGMSSGEVDYILDVSGMDGQSTIKLEGSFPEQDMVEKAADIAKTLVGKLCSMKPFHVKGGMNDLVINQTVCDVTKPFTLRGSGASAGIRLTLAPSAEGLGDFVVSGNAAGVRWSGGGTYRLVVGESGGTLNLTGAWKISTPMGNFPGSGTIKTKLTPADDCKDVAPVKATEKKKKKKK